MGGLTRGGRDPFIVELEDRFGLNVRDLRALRDISLETLSVKTGIPAYALAQIEGRRARGVRAATIGEAVVIAEALGVRAGHLLRERG
jgi:transcriptional regulator with XRE-family HTH domain